MNIINSFPSHIQLQTHSSCNLACKLCPHPTLGLNKNKGVMSDELFTQIVDEALEYDEFKSFVLDLQNEPLLDKTIEQKIRYIKKKKNVFVGITTNGVNLTSNRTQKLINSGVDRIVVSLNATNQDEFQTIVDTVPFSKILKNLQSSLAVKNSSKVIKVSFGITANNLISLTKFIRFFSKTYVDYRLFSMNDRIGQVITEDLLIENEQDKHLAYDKIAGSHTKICQIPVYAMTIKCTGKVITCCEDWNEDVLLGDISEESIFTIWNRKKNRIIRERIYYEGVMPNNPCSKCTSARTVPAPYRSFDNDKVFIQSNSAFTTNHTLNSTNLVPICVGDKYFLRNIFTGDKLEISEEILTDFEQFPEVFIRANSEYLKLNEHSSKYYKLALVSDGKNYTSAYLNQKTKIIELCDKLEVTEKYLVKNAENGVTIEIKGNSFSSKEIVLSKNEYKAIEKYIKYSFGYV